METYEGGPVDDSLESLYNKYAERSPDAGGEGYRQPFLDRVIEGTKKGFGADRLGLSPENQIKYDPTGIFQTFAAPADLVLRAPTAITGFLSSLLAGGYGKIPGVNETQTNSANRDLYNLGNAAMLELGNPRARAPTDISSIPRYGEVLPPVPSAPLTAIKRAEPPVIDMYGEPRPSISPAFDLPASQSRPLSLEYTAPVVEPTAAPVRRAKEVPVAAPVPTYDRQLSPLGFYSYGAETAANLAQAKGTPQQFRSMLEKGGVKPVEMEGFNEAFANRPSVTRDELTQYFNERRPQVEETVLGGTVLGGKEPFDAERLARLEQEYAALKQHPVDDPSFGEDKYNELIRLMNIRDQSSTQSLYDAANQAMGQGQRAQRRGDRATADRYFREYEFLNTRAEKLDLQGEGMKNPSKYSQYQLPGGENYREILLTASDPQGSRAAVGRKYDAKIDELTKNSQALNDELKRLYRSNAPGNDFIRAKDSASDAYFELRTLTEQRDKELGLLQYEKPFTSTHWGDPNVLAHLRMSDRTGPNGEKILHIEEIQSDWGQKGKKEGFAQKLDPKILDQLGEEQTSAMFQMEDARKVFNDSFENIFKDNLKNSLKDAPTQFDIPNALKIYDDIIKSKHPQKRFDEYKSNFLQQANTFTPEQKALLLDSYNKHFKAEDAYNAAKDKKAEYTSLSNGLPTAPYVTNTQAWTDLALKRALKEAAEGGYDKLVWTPGVEQAKRYPEGGPKREEGLKTYYDKIIPNQLSKLVKKLDPEAKIEAGRMPVEGRNKGSEDIARELGMTIDQINALPDAEKRALIGSVRNTISAPGVDMTPKMREAIMKGQTDFARGGSVKGYADGGSTNQGLRRLLRKYAEGDAFPESALRDEDTYGPDMGQYRTDRAQGLSNFVNTQLTSGTGIGGALSRVRQNIANSSIVRGLGEIPGTVGNYFSEVTAGPDPSQRLGQDLGKLGSMVWEGVKADPVGAVLDVLPVVGEIRSGMDAEKFSNMAVEAEIAGDNKQASMFRQLATVAAAGTAPLAGVGVRLAKRGAKAGEVAAQRAFHTTMEPFENYDWSQLGLRTAENASDSSMGEWAVNLAKIGPWAHEADLTKKMGGISMPVDILGVPKSFKSLNTLEAAVKKAGGPEAFREDMTRKGFGYIKVDDEEFGGKSFIALQPDKFKKAGTEGAGAFVREGVGGVEQAVETAARKQNLEKQIKSATGNRGTYDLKSPVITEAKGGSVKGYAEGGPEDNSLEALYNKYADGGSVSRAAHVYDPAVIAAIAASIVDPQGYAEGGQVDVAHASEWDRYLPRDLPDSAYGDLQHNLKYLPLNIKRLLDAGAIRITQPGSGVAPGNAINSSDPEKWSLVTAHNDRDSDSYTRGWASKPESYESAIKILNNPGALYDGKYRQILWSARNLGLRPDEVFMPEEETRSPAASGRGYADGGSADNSLAAFYEKYHAEPTTRISYANGGPVSSAAIYDPAEIDALAASIIEGNYA